MTTAAAAAAYLVQLGSTDREHGYTVVGRLC